MSNRRVRWRARLSAEGLLVTLAPGGSSLRRRLRRRQVPGRDELPVTRLEHPGRRLLELRLLAAELHAAAEEIPDDALHDVTMGAERRRSRGRGGKHELRRILHAGALRDRVARCDR